MFKWGQPDRLHTHLDRVEIVHLHPDMIERRALGIARFRMLAVGAGIERAIGGVAAEMDRERAIAGGAAPAFMPAADIRPEAGGAGGLTDGQIRMPQEGMRQGKGKRRKNND